MCVCVSERDLERERGEREREMKEKERERKRKEREGGRFRHYDHSHAALISKAHKFICTLPPPSFLPQLPLHTPIPSPFTHIPVSIYM